MSQAEILDILEKNQDCWMSSKEINLECECSQTSLWRSLKRLRQHKVVLFQEKDTPGIGNGTRFLYKHKKGVKEVEVLTI